MTLEKKEDGKRRNSATGRYMAEFRNIIGQHCRGPCLKVLGSHSSFSL